MHLSSWLAMSEHGTPHPLLGKNDKLNSAPTEPPCTDTQTISTHSLLNMPVQEALQALCPSPPNIATSLSKTFCMTTPCITFANFQIGMKQQSWLTVTTSSVLEKCLLREISVIDSNAHSHIMTHNEPVSSVAPVSFGSIHKPITSCNCGSKITALAPDVTAMKQLITFSKRTWLNLCFCGLFNACWSKTLQFQCGFCNFAHQCCCFCFTGDDMCQTWKSLMANQKRETKTLITWHTWLNFCKNVLGCKMHFCQIESKSSVVHANQCFLPSWVGSCEFEDTSPVSLSFNSLSQLWTWHHSNWKIEKSTCQLTITSALAPVHNETWWVSTLSKPASSRKRWHTMSKGVQWHHDKKNRTPWGWATFLTWHAHKQKQALSFRFISNEQAWGGLSVIVINNTVATNQASRRWLVGSVSTFSVVKSMP